jgi:hypothetical protein
MLHVVLNLDHLFLIEHKLILNNIVLDSDFILKGHDAK